MPIKLKGTVRPGEADRRYYMIRVQVAGRRMVISSHTKDKTLALKKEGLIVEALQNNPEISKADLVALVTGSGSPHHRAAVLADRGLTLKGAFDRCLNSSTLWRDIATRSVYEYQASVMEDILGADTPLAAIDFFAVSKLTETLLNKKIPRKDGTTAKLAGATVCNYLACLRRMFNAALEQNWPDAPKAFPKVKGVKKRKGREYFMSAQHESLIFPAVLALDTVKPGAQGGKPRRLDAHRYHKLFVVLLETGMRLSEGLGLRWGELDFPRPDSEDDGGYQGMIELFRADDIKTGRLRSIPMTVTARKALMACKGVKDGPFADLNYDRAEDIWTQAKRDAGVTHKDCVIHCLRHTCASRLLKSGVDIKIVKEWLGHSSIVTTDIYTHLDTEQLLGAAGSLNKLRTPGHLKTSRL